MAKQTINIGTTANDGTGDKIRNAFNKVNQNFTELYDDGGTAITVTDPTTSSDAILNDALQNIFASGGGGVQDLQGVTDNGNVTTNSIEVDFLQTNGDVLVGKVGAGGGVVINSTSISGQTGTIRADNATSDREAQLPDKNGEFAFLDDIPIVDSVPTDGSSNAVSSNGVFDALALKADISAVLLKANNLSDLANAGTARTNLGLGTASTANASALTKTDDTNVTLTLGGTPATSLLQAVSLTLGWTGTLADARISSATAWNAKVSSITGTANRITVTGTTTPTLDIGSDVVTLTGSQTLTNKTLTTPIIATVYGSASSGANLTLGSTSNATKGKILFGTSAYDEVNNRLGIGLTSPLAPFVLSATRATATFTGNLSPATPFTDTASLGAWQNSNTVYTFNQGSANSGGVALQGFTSADVNAFILDGNSGASSPTVSAIMLRGWKTNGSTGRTAMTGNEKILGISAGSGTETATFLANGNVGIGQTAPTAVLHLKAGTATANTAPLKLTSGTNLTTPENGAFEFDGTNLYFTVGGTRKTVTLI